MDLLNYLLLPRVGGSWLLQRSPFSLRDSWVYPEVCKYVGKKYLYCKGGAYLDKAPALRGIQVGRGVMRCRNHLEMREDLFSGFFFSWQAHVAAPSSRSTSIWLSLLHLVFKLLLGMPALLCGETPADRLHSEIHPLIWHDPEPRR